MILHFVTDEKFTDYAIKQFSAPEMESEFVLIPSNYTACSNVELRDRVRVVEQGSHDFTELLQSLRDYSSIVLHGMMWGEWQTQILKNVPNNVKVAWVFWGGELYGRNDVYTSFLSPISAFLKKIHLRKETPNTSWQVDKELLKRVDYILTDEKEEYEYARDYIGSRAKFLFYNYYTLRETLGDCYDCEVQGRNIFLGNSASLENNHYEVMMRLKRIGVNDRIIYVPLSYGAPWNRNLVIKLGKMLFQNSFSPLVAYMPRNEYNKLMRNCGTMIMNHYRPQAQGNMITGLWMGMRLYMSEKSMTYQYFKRIGLKVFSVENDLQTIASLSPLQESDILYNRMILNQYYAEEQMTLNLRKIVNELNS